MTRSLEADTQSEDDGDAWRKNWLIRVAGTILAVAIVVTPTMGLVPMLEYGDSYLKILLAAAVAAAVLAGTWGILMHGDLKQRSDFAVALAIALVLLALAELAQTLYGPEWVWSKTCTNAAAAQFFPECSDAGAVFRYNHNAATLDQIYAVLAVGQIVPMLSIFKDAVYCWLKPTPWYELHKNTPDAGSIRRANFRRGRIPNN
ncbi:hypothetical protein [Arthrobacter sp. ov118]|uniref:hypothetical protein n=1 Tax=Arthrobacter sp. ov118 TaxID=1761747 RepID=UPI0008EB13A4|nr:hypothetical protein [Arthrobacter sp. ov118]SFU11183.1 hypothetical protein SAMN04487915_11198 [Arthrobacter sp. ov118]